MANTQKSEAQLREWALAEQLRYETAHVMTRLGKQGEPVDFLEAVYNGATKIERRLRQR